LLAPKAESDVIVFQGNINQSSVSWMKRVGRVEPMDIIGNHSMRAWPLSPKTSA
jgi:hypothetical protein